MATDIAKIGFGVETSQLEKGVATLNSFSASAKSANNSAKSVGTAMNGAAKVFAAAVAGMSKSIASLVSVTQGATAEQIKAANEAAEFADRVYRAAQAQDKLAASTQKVTAAVKGQYNAFLKAASNESVLNRINRITGVTGLTGMSAKLSAMNIKQGKTAKEWAEAIGETPRDMMPNRFNTANIAAQFQDIGVTAAMGMNPLLIALQQGTQLSAVLNSMEKPIQGLADAFKQIINPTSLWTIALTALAVVGLQMVDWIGVAQSSLNGLASAMDFVASHSDTFLTAVTAISTALVVFKGQAIFAGITSGFKSVLTILTSLGGVIATVLTSPITLTIAAVAGLITIFTNFKDEINGFFGFDFVGVVKSAVNSMIGMFVGALRNVYDLFKWLWDKAKELFGGNEVERSLLDTFANNMNESMNFDYIGGASNLVSSAADAASTKLKEWSNSLNDVDKKTQKLKEAWKDLQNQMNQDIAGLQLDKKLIGVDTYTSTFEKTKADLMNQATNAGIPLTPDKIAYIKEAADETAYLTAENEKLTDSFNTAKSITSSFFQDLRQDLRDGVSAWEAFGNAVTNVLDAILQKMLEVGVDSLFEGIGGMGTKGGEETFSWGNIFSSIGGLFSGGESSGGGLLDSIGSWFSGSGDNSNGGFSLDGISTAIAAWFSTGMPLPFAKGGAFTNGVYNSPTLFKFANGGQFGVMGEAGPEAVMPLRRGPDGSLGVQADGVGKDVVVNVYNNSNAQASVNRRETSQGMEIDVMIDQLVGEKLSQPGTSSNNAMTAFNNRRLVMR